ncbi:hypothetical protein [Streptomyces griseocarneus]|uniref:hypothetical protein n=1 Tax=Streptomyces griseocarneus TaxID=51201 RepID=UPI00167D5B82|nr:hypothetical protein [Streptomyces griseocarneus]MBZ6475080.1 hypothetical protein [Streptomyces griseocarneus]GHG62365.1 hypothetical protein GCM10018779_31010 [Streptomyces griseocarneus]
MRAVRVTAGVCTLLLATGCGTFGGGSAIPRPSSAARTEAAPPPPPDKGPLCDGDKDRGPGIEGIRILKGGFARLPGGATVAYAEARSDGASRKAVLAEGETPADLRDGQHWTVAPREDLTVKGHAYTVRQICTYRVVLTPKNADEASPTPTPTPQGGDMNTWPAVADGRWRLAAGGWRLAAGGWRLRWHVPHTQYGGEGYSVVLSGTQDNPKRADIGVGSGDAEPSPDFRPGYVDLRLVS